MLQSMTGYGRATAELPGKKITVEIRALNSKLNDLNIKIPHVLREKDPEIRNLLIQRLERGKIDLTLSSETLCIKSMPAIDTVTVKNYFEQLKALAEELDIKITENALMAVLRFPDSLRQVKEELAEEEWMKTRVLIEEAADNLISYRREEGKALEKDIGSSVRRIMDALPELSTFEPVRADRIREKLSALLETSLPSDKIDRNRLEQEIIFYLEKFDINEEKVRLMQHCEYFLQKMNEDSSNGKILGFIAQEIGREINTIGSKANNADMQKIVVMMKDDLEKIKEQLLNVL